MGKIKDIVKAVTPPLIINALKKPNAQQPDSGMWSGNYANWAEAKPHATGYDDSSIMEKCKEALLKVKNGEAVYERDSVLFDTIQYNWPLLAILENVALENEGKLCVIDFGGSLGSTYYQCRDFLKSLKSLEWCIVEQGHFVDCGKKDFEDGKLKFYHSVEECLEKHKPNLLLLSGVVQYLENPEYWLNKFVGHKFCKVVLDRTSLIEDVEDRVVLQEVPEQIYKASYPCWFFSEKKLLSIFETKYDIVTSFESFADPVGYLSADGKKMSWKGFYMEQKKGLL